MAILDKSKRPYISDRDTNIFIGLDMPLRKSSGKEGWFASTSTTIEAVKNNIRNLIQTHQGERLMQPKLGMNLRKYLFQPFDEEVGFGIQQDIVDTFGRWLPFVSIRDIEVDMPDNNILNINIIFSISQDPSQLESVSVTITEGE